MRYLLVALLFASCTKQIATKPNPDPLVVAVPKPSYFIKADGSGSNTGLSPEQAWDLDKANNFSFSPGDTINIIGTVNGMLVLSESGTADAMITIQGGTIFSDTKDGIYLYNNDHILVRNLTVLGSGKVLTTLTNSGIVLKSDDQKRHSHIVIDNIVAKGYGHAGINSSLDMSPTVAWESVEASMAYPGGYDSILIRNAVADSNGYAGIDMTGSWPGRQNRNILIEHSSTSHNRGIQGMKPHSGHGIIMANVSGGIIDSCSATNNGWEFGSGNVGIWAYSSENVTIQNSVSSRNKSTTGIDGDGFDLDGGTWNCVMQYNLAYENDGAGFLIYEYGDPYSMKNNTCRYNISNNDARKGMNYGGITIGGAAALYDIRIYNNTIVQNQGKAITKIGMAVQGILEIKNNILSSPDTPYLYQDVANNLLGDAKLDAKYTPLDNSPAVDNGLDISSLPNRDFYDKNINGRRDIGAVER
ncbi:right-handed parallel beta-helix repeat-containing protein [Flavihumibacter profundi]|uniref:right-handed parallel beta-helix repeat-containing protein n=1 Tax=Flavihumibacter profundi TaxID=2716883 RepID=UPI001CC63480|nr:right-handed parallel beta-helix repeat-containing protein [Flavihumibacter profundi]MBZ5858014.1 right-handed parallel beta-helix repeat-containing protein [Flavihumibacter profundi]